MPTSPLKIFWDNQKKNKIKKTGKKNPNSGWNIIQKLTEIWPAAWWLPVLPPTYYNRLDNPLFQRTGARKWETEYLSDVMISIQNHTCSFGSQPILVHIDWYWGYSFHRKIKRWNWVPEKKRLVINNHITDWTNRRKPVISFV